MRPLAELQKDFEVAGSLGDIIDVFKMAAVIEFRYFATRTKPPQDLPREVAQSLADVRAELETRRVVSGVFNPDTALPAVIILVTPDEGFTGELTPSLVNAALEKKSGQQDEILVLGERGVRYLEDQRKNYFAFPGLKDSMDGSEAFKVRDHFFGDMGTKFGSAWIVYPHFISLSVQKLTVASLYPVPAAALPSPRARGFAGELLIEPDASQATAALARLWVGCRLLECFWSAKLGEYAARIMNLESSAQELADLKKKFSLEYFKQVHAVRDKSIREITSSKIVGNRK
jgi:F0F1-type ATP synthase gamma subunit